MVAGCSGVVAQVLLGTARPAPARVRGPFGDTPEIPGRLVRTADYVAAVAAGRRGRSGRRGRRALWTPLSPVGACVRAEPKVRSGGLTHTASSASGTMRDVSPMPSHRCSHCASTSETVSAHPTSPCSPSWHWGCSTRSDRPRISWSESHDALAGLVSTSVRHRGPAPCRAPPTRSHVFVPTASGCSTTTCPWTVVGHSTNTASPAVHRRGRAGTTPTLGAEDSGTRTSRGRGFLRRSPPTC